MLIENGEWKMDNENNSQFPILNSPFSTLHSPLVPPGYKQTEVGVIPEDWAVKPLHTLADKIMVGIASAATHAYRDRGVLMFRNQNIKPGHLDDSAVLYIDEVYEETYRNKRLKAGDLLTA